MVEHSGYNPFPLADAFMKTAVPPCQYKRLQLLPDLSTVVTYKIEEAHDATQLEAIKSGLQSITGVFDVTFASQRAVDGSTKQITTNTLDDGFGNAVFGVAGGLDELYGYSNWLDL
jgi:hypothetical protein